MKDAVDTSFKGKESRWKKYQLQKSEEVQEEKEEKVTQPGWVKLRENVDLDEMAHKLMSGQGLNTEETLATAAAELIQRCTGIKKVPKLKEADKQEDLKEKQ